MVGRPLDKWEIRGIVGSYLHHVATTGRELMSLTSLWLGSGVSPPRFREWVAVQAETRTPAGDLVCELHQNQDAREIDFTVEWCGVPCHLIVFDMGYCDEVASERLPQRRSQRQAASCTLPLEW